MRFAAFSVLALLTTAVATPAAADGGRGGNGFSGGTRLGGAGGTDSPTGAGGAGSNGTGLVSGGGGGGAGAVTGGAGGFNFNGSPGPGRGGTGGVHGSVGTDQPAGVSTGSNGGAGGAGLRDNGGGGGGGGGYGAVVTGMGTAGTITGNITAGNGGAGGSSALDQGGSGGSGGIGLLFTDGSLLTTLTVNAGVRGGNGGAGGVGGDGDGSHGAGGAGIVGSNLSITNNGTIAGGLSSDGTTRAAAINFTGGANTLTFGNAASGLTGDIGIVSGSLTFAQPTDVTVSNAITGAGSVSKIGAGTLILTSVNTYTGGTTIAGGAISVGADENLGDASGGLTFDGGTLITTASFVSARDVTLNAGGGTIDTGANTFELSGSITGAGGLTKIGTGTLLLSGFPNGYTGATNILAGELAAANSSLSVSSDITVAADARLTVLGTNLIGSLSGAGTVDIAAFETLYTGFNGGSATFSGKLTGDGSFSVEGATQILTGSGSAIGGMLELCGCADTKLILRGGDLSVGGDILLDGGVLSVEQGAKLTALPTSFFGMSDGSFLVDGAASRAEIGSMLALSLGNAVITVSGGGTLISGGVSLEATDFFGSTSVDATVTGANSSWTINSSGGLSVGLGSSRPVTVSVADGGKLVTDLITIESNGTLNLGLGGLPGTIATPFITNFGRIVADFTGEATLAANIDGAGTLTKQGSGTLTLSGANSYTGSTFLNGGILSIASDANLGDPSSTLVFNGGTLRIAGTGLAALARPIVFDTAGGGFDIADAAASITLAQSLGGSGSLTKSGAGTLVLAGNNTYVGGTLVKGGTLSVAGDGNLGDAAGAITLDGGVLRVTGTGFAQTGRAINLGAGGGGFDIVEAAHTFTLTQGLSGSGGLIKSGAGTLVMAGLQGYSGATNVAEGTLRAGAVGVFSPGSAFTIAAGARLDLAGLDQSIGSLTGAGAVSLGSARLSVGSDGGSTSFAGAISGTGSLAKQGAGTLTLTGANTYTGGTTISGGTLIGNTTSLQGPITNNAVLVFDQAAAGTFAGGIFGTGSLVKQGAGALTLTGTSFYSGSTTIGAGTLIANTASLQGPILNNAALVFDQAATGAFAGAISGTGTLTKQGAGTLTLTGANSYSGGTTIGAGTLVGNTTSLQGPIVNDAALIFDQATGGTFAGTISGTGTLTKQGAGRLTLTGANSYSGGTTIGGGTLVGNTTSLQGPIVNNAALVFDQAADGIFADVISGTGTLTKQGAGSLTLTGASTMSGPTLIEAGHLVLNGSLANSSVTMTGGIISGNGTVGGLVAQGGTVAPGNSIGTLSANNNIGFGAAIYQVELNASGASDRIVTAGAALLVGGRVQVLAASGAYAQSTRYSILTAQGGVSGRFASVTSDLAFLTPVLSYDPGAVVLTMTRNDTDFGPTPDGGAPRAFIAATRNQSGVARAAQALGAGNRIHDTLLGTTAEQARAGFDSLSGEAHAQAVAVSVEDSHLIRESILNRLRAPFGPAAAGGSIEGAFTADLPGRKSATAMPAPVFDPSRFTVWGEAIGAKGSTDRDGNAASLHRSGGGMLLGMEMKSDTVGAAQWRLGVAGGYTQTDFDIDARSAKGELSSAHGAIYGGTRFGAVSFRAGAAYAWSETDMRRQVSLPGFTDNLRLDGRSATAQAFAEIGYGLTFGSVALEPFAQIAAVSIRTDRAAEQGGAAALVQLGRDQRLGFTTLGLRAEAQLGALPLIARGMLGWRHAFGDTTPAADLAFVAGATPFRSYAAPLARDTLLAEAGLAWKASSSTTLGISYGAALSDKARDHALKGRIDIAF